MGLLFNAADNLQMDSRSHGQSQEGTNVQEQDKGDVAEHVAETSLISTSGPKLLFSQTPRMRTLRSRRHSLMQHKIARRASAGRVRYFDVSEEFGAIAEENEDGEDEDDIKSIDSDDSVEGVGIENDADADDYEQGKGEDDGESDEEEDEETARAREAFLKAEKKKKQAARIRRKTQLLKPSEADLAYDGGWKDLVRGIVQSEMAVLRQPSPLALSLKCLWLDSNLLQELPESFQNFKGLGAVQIENNPMRSPPAEIAVRGPVALAKYCKLRVERMHKTTAAFNAAGIHFNDHLLAPTAEGFLLPE